MIAVLTRFWALLCEIHTLFSAFPAFGRRPRRHVERLGRGRYRALTNDPQAPFRGVGGLKNGGWACLKFRLNANRQLNPTLYIAHTPDWSQFSEIRIPHSGGRACWIGHIRGPVCGLRFDPDDQPGEFNLSGLRIHRIGWLHMWLYLFPRFPARTTAAYWSHSFGYEKVARAEVTRLLRKAGLAGPDPYEIWLKQRGRLSDVQVAGLRAHSAVWPDPPKISVVMPVYNTNADLLTLAIQSVCAQAYENWELCVVDDASPAPHVAPLLTQLAAEDPRVTVITRPRNGHISAATNSALDAIDGEFVPFMDHDDLLTRDALHHIARSILEDTNVDFLYSDEDKIDEHGARLSHHFKPTWNEDMLMSHNYINHLSVIRRSVLMELGGLREGFEGSQDHDLILRMAARTPPERIRHIPRILYHWRAFTGSGSFSDENMPQAIQSRRAALQDYLKATGRKGRADSGFRGRNRVIWPLPSPEPLVSVIIPTRNMLKLTRQCVDGVLNRTDYQNVEVLIVDNDSDDPAALAWLQAINADPRVRVLRHPGPFNFSAINNRAAEKARGDVLCLLNNDVNVKHPDWLREMASQALRPEIGAVGAKLLYEDGRIQHAGVIVGITGVAGHMFRFLGEDDEGYHARPQVAQNLSAVTAACLAVERRKFLAVDGFDAQNLKVAFNDVDLCLRLATAGWRTLYTPHAALYHLESATRGSDHSPEKRARFEAEKAYMARQWGERLRHDPCYNPNLSRDTENFDLDLTTQRQGADDRVPAF